MTGSDYSHRVKYLLLFWWKYLPADCDWPLSHRAISILLIQVKVSMKVASQS